MTLSTLRKYILNLFIDIKNKFFIMIDHEKTAYHSTFLIELYQILSQTLTKIENIYYKYILYPQLQKIYVQVL
jgi:hypothetical protein